MRQMAQRITLGLAAVVGDFFVATGERNGLEAEEADGLGIVERELNDASDLLVVDAVDDGGDGYDVHAVFVQVVDGAQLHVKQIADLAMRVGGVADAVKLQIRVTQSGFRRLAAELRRLGKLDSVGRGLHGVVSNFAGIANGVEEVWRKRWLAAGELD